MKDCLHCTTERCCLIQNIWVQVGLDSTTLKMGGKGDYKLVCEGAEGGKREEE